MNNELFDKAIEILSPNALRVEVPTDKTVNFLNTYNIPIQVIDFLSRNSFNQTLRFKHVYFSKVNEIAENNLYEENKKCIDERLLIIGSGLNGDMIVLDLNNLQVGYVFHDELWENESITSREIYVSMDCSVGEFYFNSITIADYPVDGFEAEDYQTK